MGDNLQSKNMKKDYNFLFKIRKNLKNLNYQIYKFAQTDFQSAMAEYQKLMNNYFWINSKKFGNLYNENDKAFGKNILNESYASLQENLSKTDINTIRNQVIKFDNLIISLYNYIHQRRDKPQNLIEVDKLQKLLEISRDNAFESAKVRAYILNNLLQHYKNNPQMKNFLYHVLFAFSHEYKAPNSPYNDFKASYFLGLKPEALNILVNQKLQAQRSFQKYWQKLERENPPQPKGDENPPKDEEEQNPPPNDEKNPPQPINEEKPNPPLDEGKPPEGVDKLQPPQPPNEGENNAPPIPDDVKMEVVDDSDIKEAAKTIKNKILTRLIGGRLSSPGGITSSLIGMTLGALLTKNWAGALAGLLFGILFGVHDLLFELFPFGKEGKQQALINTTKYLINNRKLVTEGFFNQHIDQIRLLVKGVKDMYANTDFGEGINNIIPDHNNMDYTQFISFLDFVATRI